MDNQDDVQLKVSTCPQNFYMDDYLESRPTVEEDSNRAKDLVKLLARGGFKRTKFVSNVSKLPTEHEPDLTSNREKTIPSADDVSHVLGLKSNHSSDTPIVSRGTSPEHTKEISQRVVLSVE